jgi:hypothetical protein
MVSYGPYSNGYTDEEKPRISMMQSRKNTKKKKIIVEF